MGPKPRRDRRPQADERPAYARLRATGRGRCPRLEGARRGGPKIASVAGKGTGEAAAGTAQQIEESNYEAVQQVGHHHGNTRGDNRDIGSNSSPGRDQGVDVTTNKGEDHAEDQ